MLTPDPFASPGLDPVSVSLEAIVVNGRGMERTMSSGQWRATDGSLGSFLQLGNMEISFRDSMGEVLLPVTTWSPVGAEAIRGIATQRFTGVAPGTNRGAVDLWVDADGRLRRVRLERGSDQTHTTATVVLELWDFGIPVSETMPP